MSRPLYESERDRAAEHEVMELALAKIQDVDKFVKLPISYGWDYGLYGDGRLQAVAEVKVRKQKYGTFFVSLHKVMRGFDYMRAGLRAYLLVRWPDGIYGHRLMEPSVNAYHVDFGGRHDRGDNADQEPVVHIPLTQFRQLGG